MASAAPARSPSLHPEDWLRAAQNRLSEHGIESVRIEVLARDLGVSKGSFYWHFRDRGELLDRLLARWEDAETRLAQRRRRRRRRHTLGKIHRPHG